MVKMAEGKKKSNKNKREKKKFFKNKRLLLLLGVILAVLIVAAFGTYKFIEHKKWEANNVLFNNYHFYKAGKLWSLNANDWRGKPEEWLFHFNPTQLKDIKQQGKISYDFMNSSEVFVTFDPYGENLSYDAVAAADLAIGLSEFFGKIVKPACTRNSTECVINNKSIEIINCTKANKEKKATVFLDQEYDQPKVTYDNYCVIIRGYGVDLVRAQEYFLMNYYGIIPNKESSSNTVLGG